MPERALGTKLLINTAAIAGLTSVNGIALTADTIDKTTLSSTGGYREFTGGFKDGGEVTASGFFDPSDTTGQVALYNAFEAGGAIPFSILFPSQMGASWNFNGVVTGFSTGAELEDMVSFEVTIKVSGKPTLNFSLSSGLTGLALTGTGGALTPTFANGTYLYAFSGVTATSVTVTATAAGQTLKLFINGEYSQDLTSGAASAAIPMLIGSKKLTILANEDGKTQKMYEVVVVKVS
ncbi:MAG: outer capsid protein Hoc [Herbinix sp.]|jgi:predicted secreted protein|nr:outer capsid protein Hoc [Herbinix sp.]